MSYKASLLVFQNKLKAVLHPLNERWKEFAVRKPRLAKWVRLSGLAFLGMVLALFVFRTAIALSVPSVRALREIQTQIATEVYSADSVLLGRYFNQYRTVVQYQDIPPHVFQALVATEDSRFYQHKGVDYRAWGRVFFRTIIRGDRSGGGGEYAEPAVG